MLYTEENYKTANSTDTFEFVCKHCGKIFLKTKRSISQNKGKLPVFCSSSCQKEFYKTNSYVIVNCSQCGKEKRILKSEYNKNTTKHFFCNRSCAAKYTNTKRDRHTDIIWEKDKNGLSKKGYNICPNCSKLKYYTSNLCSECRNKQKQQNIKNKTLGYFIENKNYLSHRCTEIRKDAKRTLLESNIEKVCAYCKNHDFDEILEVHHIKGILEHSMDTSINEINSLDNLVWLCPNHHAMLEKGLITL